jgi:hypothetical protein
MSEEVNNIRLSSFCFKDEGKEEEKELTYYSNGLS